MLTVEALPAEEGWRCTVDVVEGRVRSRHTVRVGRDDLTRLGRSGESPKDLVTRAFRFLLAREPAGQILRAFDLTDISRYFPEFEREMA